MKKITLTNLKPEQWEIYKKIKLKSLLTDPIAFAATHEQAVAYSDEEWKQKLTKSGDIWLFAKYSEKFIGIIGAHTKNAGKESSIATIVGVYVEPKYRGIGVGKLLMNKILKDLKKHEEIIKVKIWVAETQIPAIDLYKSCGFKLIGKKKNEIFFEGKYFDELIMEKEVT
ncbi:MAG: GNAT family N-acetyltransferase [Sphingobacteriales bacterium]|nr:GNAT family N-acetyltransferase [Sphingobacteriales bacterium]